MFLVQTHLQYSQIHGIGVFTDEGIAKGQTVWQFDSRIDLAISIDELIKFPPAMQAYLKIYSYIELKNGKRIMILCADNAKYINHNNDANLIDTRDGLREIAARDIAEGEELTNNYYNFDLEAPNKLGREIVKDL
jgi:SET domain-containing protein